MPTVGVYKGDSTPLSYGVEENEYYELSGATIGSTTITDATQNFGASGRLKGQYLWILSGTAVGRQYQLTNSTSTVLTCDAATFSADGVGANDKIAISTYGIKPAATDKFFGVVESAPGLEEEIDVKEFYTAAAGRDRFTSVEGAHKIEETLEFLVLLGGVILCALGGEATVGSSPSNATTLNGAIKAGAKKIVLASAAGYLTNDYFQVSSGIDFTVSPLKNIAEVRKITAVVTNTLTLDAPLSFDHDTGQAVNEVVAPYTHTFGGITRLPSLCVERVFRAVADLVLHTRGLKFNELTVSGEKEGPLKASVGVLARDTAKGLASASVLTVPSTRPYYFDQGLLTFNGFTVAKLVKFSHKIGNGAKLAHYIQTLAVDGRLPLDAIEGKRHHEARFTTNPIDSTFFDLIKTSAELNASILFTRGANDTLSIAMNGWRTNSAKHPIPEEGAVEVEIQGMVKTTVITVVDSTPWYIGTAI